MKKLSWIWRPLRWGFAAFGLIAVAAASMLASPLSQPAMLSSIHAGAMAVDRTNLPPLSRFQARDGSYLAYRFYPAADGNTDRIAVMIHGSAEGSTVMNEMARKFAAENYTVVAPDIRGHGASGTIGDIAYLGQLDDDAEDLVAELRRQYPKARFGLVGFSAGGAFALRLAGGRLAAAFDRVVLISPALGPFAPSTRPMSASSNWAGIDMPRILALTALQRLGLPCCDSLPIVAFATAPGESKFVTSQYSYRLARNFGASYEYDADFHNLMHPTTILVGEQDELMAGDRYHDIVRGIEPKIDIKIMPGLGHMDMVHAPAALDAVLKAFRQVTAEQQSSHKHAQLALKHAIIAADMGAPLTWLLNGGEFTLSTFGALVLIISALLAVPVSRPAELQSVSAGRKKVDETGLPNFDRFQARDGSELAYRLYPATNTGVNRIAILIHGSGGVSSGLNQIAHALAAKGMIAIVPDMRGFGNSGTRGDIGYIGQLDNDMADLVASLHQRFPGMPLDLLGFSSGGGFALRIAAGEHVTAFSRLVLLSPYLGRSAPSTKPPKESARWANADVPRILALTFLGKFGIRLGETLPVIAFAVPPGSEAAQSAQWSYRLLMNFGAPRDLAVALRSLKMPATIIAGDADELLASDKFASLVEGITPQIAVKILPGLDHLAMLSARSSMAAIAAALEG